MNTIWTAIMFVSIGYLIIINPEIAFDSMLTGGTKAIALSLKLWAIYSIWLGLLKIIEETRLDSLISKILNPIIDFLFGHQPKETKNQLAINITSNILGMGNACTPSGIEGMRLLGQGSKKLTTAMAMLIILNTTNIQLIPTTVIGLRITAGSINPNSIIFPTLIATTVSTIVGVILVKICGKIWRTK